VNATQGCCLLGTDVDAVSYYRQERQVVNAIDLAEKLATFTGYWQPRTIGQFNDHDLMVAKAKGEFTWHKHDETDDFFLVLKGRLTIKMRDGNVTLGAGQMFVVPKGIEHCPVAEEEAHILLIEQTGTPNTGNSETAAPRRQI
jgi:mannose-6-phosphate isomerase-like protein (cupin superfamily)